MVFFDEAGNTGDNLLDADQPVFTLASHDFDLEETHQLLDPLYSIVNSRELHFKSLSKRPRYQKEIINLLNNKALSGERVFKFTVHKEYAIIAHIVDRLIEYVMYLNGIDLYKEGQNLAMANMIYVLYKSVWKSHFTLICNLFVNWVRNKTAESCEAFYNAVSIFFDKMQRENILGEEFIGFIKMSYKYWKEIQQGFDQTYTLDSTLSTFRASCIFWSKKYTNPTIVIDESKPIAHFKPIIDMLKSSDEQIVGYGNRKYQFKLKIGDVVQASSDEYSQIQLSDILASAFNFCAKNLTLGDELSGFAREIFNSFSFQNVSGDNIWPTTKVTAENIGMKGATTGRNPLDHFANEMIKTKL